MLTMDNKLLENIQTGFAALVEQGQKQAKPKYAEIATIVPSQAEGNKYKWLGKMPNMTAWNQQRDVNDLSSGTYSITNQNYEVTIGVDRNDIEDDNLGIYSPVFIELGRSASLYPDKLLAALIESGEGTSCHDGQNFFSTTHNTDKSNLLADASYTGSAWYVLATQRAVRPFIFQNRRAPSLKALVDENDDKFFATNTYQYGIDMRCNVGFGLWQMAVKVKKTLNKANLQSAMQKISSFRTNDDKELGLRANILLVPPALEISADEIVGREIIVDGTNSVSNVLKNKIKTIVLDDLA